MIDRQTWLILARRLEELQRLRDEAEAWEELVVLVYDSNDQARVA